MSLDNSVESIEIRTAWGHYNTSLLTSKLYRHVERGELEFELDVEEGSVLTDFMISFLGGLSAMAVAEMAKYLWKRSKDADERGNERTSPVLIIKYIDGDVKEYEINQSTVELLERRFGEG